MLPSSQKMCDPRNFLPSQIVVSYFQACKRARKKELLYPLFKKKLLEDVSQEMNGIATVVRRANTKSKTWKQP